MCNFSTGFYIEGYVEGFIEGFAQGCNESAGTNMTASQAALLIYIDDELLSKIAEDLHTSVEYIKQEVKHHLTAEVKSIMKI